MYKSYKVLVIDRYRNRSKNHPIMALSPDHAREIALRMYNWDVERYEICVNPV